MSIEKEFEKILEHFRKSYPAGMFRDKAFYADWLAQTYYFVCHSTPLLGYSLPHLKTQGLRHHFEHHIGEEERHELLALKDIERLNYRISDFPEYESTKAFYQAQYYKIQFEGATALLGYILFLEGMAVHWGKEIYQEVKGPFPTAALFIKVHAEEDPKHLEDALRTIYSLSASEQAAILANLRYSQEMYQAMLCRVKEAQKLKAA